MALETSESIAFAAALALITLWLSRLRISSQTVEPQPGESQPAQQIQEVEQPPSLNYDEAKVITCDVGDRSLPVLKVHVVIFFVRNMPRNHWALSLEVPGGRSVFVDFVGNDHEPNFLAGEARFISKPFVISNQALKHVTFPCILKDGATVQNIMDMVVLRRRDAYKLVKTQYGFEGCRFWVLKMISDLEQVKVLQTGSVHLIQIHMEKLWLSETDGRKIYSQMQRGYYEVERMYRGVEIWKRLPKW